MAQVVVYLTVFCALTSLTNHTDEMLRRPFALAYSVPDVMAVRTIVSTRSSICSGHAAMTQTVNSS